MPRPDPMPLDFPSDTRHRPSREEHFVLEDLPERERMLWGVLAYVFFPVSVYYARWDPFVRFHVRQAVGMVIAWIVADRWQRFAWSNEIPEVSWVGYAAVTLGVCYGMKNALSLQFRPVPWVGWLSDRFLPLPKRLAEPARTKTPVA